MLLCYVYFYDVVYELLSCSGVLISIPFTIPALYELPIIIRIIIVLTFVTTVTLGSRMAMENVQVWSLLDIPKH